MRYKIGFTDLGRDSIRALAKNVQGDVLDSIRGLALAPECGKPLTAPLSGLRSIRIRNRWRVVYRIDGETVIVEFTGERRPGMKDDVYAAAERLLKNLKKNGKS